MNVVTRDKFIFISISLLVCLHGISNASIGTAIKEKCNVTNELFDNRHHYQTTYESVDAIWNQTMSNDRYSDDVVALYHEHTSNHPNDTLSHEDITMPIQHSLITQRTSMYSDSLQIVAR